MHHGIIYSRHTSSIKVVHLKELGGVEEAELFGKFAVDQVYHVDTWGLAGNIWTTPLASPQETVQRVQDALKADVPVHCSPDFNSRDWAIKMKVATATNTLEDGAITSSQQSGQGAEVGTSVTSDLIPALRAGQPRKQVFTANIWLAL